MEMLGCNQSRRHYAAAHRKDYRENQPRRMSDPRQCVLVESQYILAVAVSHTIFLMGKNSWKISEQKKKKEKLLLISWIQSEKIQSTPTAMGKK